LDNIVEGNGVIKEKSDKQTCNEIIRDDEKSVNSLGLDHQHFSCPICQDVYKKAVQTKCTHIFCKECIDKALTRSKLCPVCQMRLNGRKSFRKDITMRRLVDEMVSPCTHCNQMLKRGNHTDHERCCELYPIVCPNGGQICGTIPRKSLEAHDSECSWKRVECPNCSRLVARIQLPKHIELFCRAVEITCRACSEKIRRGDVKLHRLKSCPLSIIDCPVSAFGCEAKVPRREMDSHQQQQAGHHITLLLQEILSQRLRIEQLSRLWERSHSPIDGLASQAHRPARNNRGDNQNDEEDSSDSGDSLSSNSDRTDSDSDTTESETESSDSDSDGETSDSE